MPIDIRESDSFVNSYNATPTEAPVSAPEVPVVPVVVTPETIQVTAAEDGKDNGQAASVATPATPEDEKALDQANAPKGEPNRVPRDKVQEKFNKLTARATASEQKYLNAQKRLDELEAEKKTRDLDALAFDDRVATVAGDAQRTESLKHEQAQAKQEIQSVHAEAWNDKLNEAQKVHSDFFEVVESAKEVFAAIPSDIQEAVSQFDDGALMAYELAKNPTLALKLAKANPIVAATILLELKQSVSQNPVAQAPVAPKVSQAPKATPTPSVSGGAPVTHIAQLPMGDFIAARRANGTLR